MSNITPYIQYPGGKGSDGTYHKIINHIPPHRVFITLFAGNCGIFKYIRPAEFSIINDIDSDLMALWDSTGLGLRGDVRLSCKDARIFLREDIDSLELQRQKKHTFIYLDPPYLFSTRSGQLPIYKHEMGGVTDHSDLLSQISAMGDHKIMISHYPNPLYDEMLKDWNTFDFTVGVRRGKRIERIYYNYELDGHLHDYSYIGENFRVREKYKRITKNFFLKLDRMEPLLRNAMLQEYELEHRNKLR